MIFVRSGTGDSLRAQRYDAMTMRNKDDGTKQIRGQGGHSNAAPAGAALWTTRLDRTSKIPLSRQLAAALREALGEGRIDAGARLPSSRALAAELGLARSTIVGVFEQLAAEGYIVGKPGSGYFAAVPLGETIPQLRTDPAAPRPLSRHGERLRGYRAPSRPTPLPFELGYAEVDTGFIATWKRLASRVLSGRASIAWNYVDPQGEPKLRRAIADYLAAARGVRCRPEQIVLTSGTQQGLSLTVQMLIDPGATAWVEDPCYRATIDILRAAETQIVPVPVDDQGLDIAAGERHHGAPPRLVYTTPSRQYPLGMAMPLPRRIALLNWAAQNGVWIVEDDYESEFQAPGRMLPSLQGLDRAGRVITMFGCGGDRDRTKRPLMGRAAGAGSDVVVVTSDNPRSEDPLAIIEQVLPGLRGTSAKVMVEPDRRHAIELAIAEAGPGDLVLLAGKGHEKTQTIGAQVIPFDDVAVARELLPARGKSE